MEKKRATKSNEKGWDPQTSYEKVNNTISEWPNWKKDAYNKMFAVSAHAEKILIKQ